MTTNVKITIECYDKELGNAIGNVIRSKLLTNVKLIHSNVVDQTLYVSDLIIKKNLNSNIEILLK